MAVPRILKIFAAAAMAMGLGAGASHLKSALADGKNQARLIESEDVNEGASISHDRQRGITVATRREMKH